MNIGNTSVEAWPFPAVGFYYTVEIFGSEGIQAAFQEVSGMEVTVETENAPEVGENRYTQKLPKKTSYGNLILKRGLYAADSKMQNWVKKAMQNGFATRVDTRDITVRLMDEFGGTIMGWNFKRCFPVKWSASGLNSMQSAIVIENIEFAYQYWTFVKH